MRVAKGAFLVAIGVALGLAARSGFPRAQAFESFTLQDHDKLIVEAPGCYAECTPVSPTVRTCVLKNFDCKAVCQQLPECKLDTMRPMQVCAVVKTR